MIRAIATDMDGTFLTSKNDYDRARFEAIYQQLKKQGILFIIASGNQYYQLCSFFPGKEEELLFAAENGAITVSGKKITPVDSFSPHQITAILNELASFESGKNVILNGVDHAYMLKKADSSFKEFARKYNYRLREVESFHSLPEDTFVKLGMNSEGKEQQLLLDHLNLRFPGELRAISSGHDSIDIILPGVNKGTTLTSLLKERGISPNELLAFGDANNDLEMLNLTPHSYAMENGNEQVKAAAQHLAPRNDDSGVLAIIETYFPLS